MSNASEQGEQGQVQEQAAVGKKWGDNISEERKVELQSYIDHWQTGDDHSERKGPFAQIQLSGADVYWLADQSESAEFGSVPHLHLWKCKL